MRGPITCQWCSAAAEWTPDDEYKCMCGWFSMGLSTADPATDPCFYAVCLSCEMINCYIPLWMRDKITHCGECGAELYIVENGQAWWAELNPPTE